MSEVTQRLAVLLAFVLVFPTALINIVLLIFLIGYVLHGRAGYKWSLIHDDPVALTSLSLFGILTVSVVYTPVSFSESISHLNKYHELLLLPMMLSAIETAYWKRLAYQAFIWAISIQVGMSYAMYFGWLPPGPPGQEWVPLTGRIAYGFFLAYGVYLMLHHAIRSQSLRPRILWMSLAIISAADLLFLISGRTGHVVLLSLLGLLLFQYWPRIRAIPRWPQIGIVLLAIVAIVVLTSPAINSRMQDVQLAAINPEASSIGQRLIFWETSLHIIADQPFLGAGVGSFAHEYVSHNLKIPDLLADNPHNEYLLIAAQVGVVGLLLFIGMLVVLFQQSRRLPETYRYAVQGLVVAMAIGCMFNSFLRDHGEGHFFAIFAGILLASVRDDEQIRCPSTP